MICTGQSEMEKGEIKHVNGNRWLLCLLTFLRKGKHPGFSTTGGALIDKSGVGHSLLPNTFNSRKHSVSTISFCHEMDTEPVLNFV